jgi:hypothetical protein
MLAVHGTRFDRGGNLEMKRWIQDNIDTIWMERTEMKARMARKKGS